MTCKLGNQQPDWKAYAFGELSTQAMRDAEIHAEACAACQEELAGLRVTLNAMATLRDEEMPRRIAFVSDKVFEPNWFQRAWQGFLRPSFAGAALVAAAIVTHAFVRPVTAPVTQVAPVQSGSPAGFAANESAASAAAESVANEARIQQAVNKALSQEVDKRVAARLDAVLNSAVDQAVAKAVADTERRDAQRTAQVLAAAERRYEDTTTFLSKQVSQMYALNTGLGVR